MSTPEVKVRISGEPQGFNAAVRSAQGSLKRLGSDLTTIQSLSSRILSGLGVASALNVAGLLALAKTSADTADSMGKLAQSTGVTVEELSRLAFAGSLSDASLQEISKALVALNRDAATGGRRLASFGVELLDSAGNAKNANALFQDVAERFASLPDGIEKTNAAIDLFGEKLGPRLIPLLNNGAEGLRALADQSDRFGKTISTTTARAAEQFNDNLTRLQALAQAAGQEVGVALLPAMNELALAFLELVQADRQIGQSSGIQEFGRTTATAVGFAVDVVDGFVRVVKIAGLAIGGLVAAFAAWYRREIPEARQILRELSRDIDEIAQRQFFSDRLDRVREEQVQSNTQLIDLQRNLTQAIGREQELRRQEARLTNQEELKGVEALKRALESAWQTSIDNARKAREEAASLFEQATDARRTAEERIQERQLRGLTPAQQQAEARFRAEEARNEAQLAASRATLASFRGDITTARKLSEDAQRAAARVERFADLIDNDADASFFLREVGKIREEAINASARIREQEARDLEDVARQQREQIEQAEARIQKLKEELQEPVQLDVDIERAAAEVDRLRQQLEQLQNRTVTVTVNTVQGGAAGPGFAGGGFTGPGGKYQPAGIVHAGEYVLRQEVVRQPGMMRLLDRLNRDGMAAMRGYSSGGAVTPINLQWPDGSSSRVSASPDVASEIVGVFRRASIKRGRR